MSLKIVVLAKQVPDTRNVGKDAMTAEGTVNRAALPAIFNPEDLNALEQALRLKDAHPSSTITILTMGPGRAAEIIREGLFRGADNGYLLTDRAFAGADTLATSYALSTAIKHVAPQVDLIIGGRQAIDGDTAQVGPQVAEKLGLSQAAYEEAVAYARDRKQFGKAIIEFPAVAEMIANIKARLDAGRALLYQTHATWICIRTWRKSPVIANSQQRNARNLSNIHAWPMHSHHWPRA